MYLCVALNLLQHINFNLQVASSTGESTAKTEAAGSFESTWDDSWRLHLKLVCARVCTTLLALIPENVFKLSFFTVGESS